MLSTLFHLPSLRFHCVGGCWDRTLALAVRRCNHSARSLPPSTLLSHPYNLKRNYCLQLGNILAKCSEEIVLIKSFRFNFQVESFNYSGLLVKVFCGFHGVRRLPPPPPPPTTPSSVSSGGPVPPMKFMHLAYVK
jgi:hypothetical protein